MTELYRVEEYDIPRLRKRGVSRGAGWCNYDMRLRTRYTRSHCWKDERKLRFQWAKHLNKQQNISDPDLAAQNEWLG